MEDLILGRISCTPTTTTTLKIRSFRDSNLLTLRLAGLADSAAEADEGVAGPKLSGHLQLLEPEQRLLRHCGQIVGRVEVVQRKVDDLEEAKSF